MLVVTYDYAVTINIGVASKLKHTSNRYPAPVNFVFEQIQQLTNFL